MIFLCHILSYDFDFLKGLNYEKRAVFDEFAVGRPERPVADSD